MMLDDILKDPESALRPDVVFKITDIYQRKIIPQIRGWNTSIHIAGTPIIEGDIYDVLALIEGYDFRTYPAIDPDTGKLLWPNMYNQKMLDSLRAEMETKAFESEYLLRKVAIIGSYINPEFLDEVIATPAMMER